MKYLIFTSLLLGAVSSLATPSHSLNEIVLARVEKNMGKVQTIDLLAVVPADSQTTETKYVLRTQMTNGTSVVTDVSAFRKTVDADLSAIDHEIVEKTNEFVCYMIAHPVPELQLPTYENGPDVQKFETTLTNYSCAFEKRVAPKSEAGEESARSLLKFMVEQSPLCSK